MEKDPGYVVWEAQTAIDKLEHLAEDPEGCHELWKSRHDLCALREQLNDIVALICPIREAAE